MTEPAEQHFATDNTRDVKFPRYWIGSVWVTLTAPHEEKVDNVELQMGTVAQTRAGAFWHDGDDAPLPGRWTAAMH